jgi:hypothetical protein
MHSIRPVLFILLLLCYGCADRDGEDPAPAPASAPTVAPLAGDTVMQERAECVNREEGYAVAYPAGWQVNSDGIFGPCSIFHPGPIEIPGDSEVPVDLAIMIGFEGVPIATLTGDVLGRREVARERTRVDGREALRIDSETTGEGLYDTGIRIYQYFVDLGDSTMVASTFDAGEPPFERKRRILDAMMRSFDFRQPG